MSTPGFLGAAVVAGLIIVVAVCAVGFLLDPLIGGAATKRRLQRRLERRLARGEDRYFEELRSIEIALAQEPAPPFSPLGMLARVPLAIVWAAMLLLLGIWLVNAIAEPLSLGAPPAWSRHLYLAVFPLVGVSHMLNPDGISRNSPWPGRFLGLIFILLGGLMFASDLSRIPS